jgi:hypothetical protein
MEIKGKRQKFKLHLPKNNYASKPYRICIPFKLQLSIGMENSSTCKIVEQTSKPQGLNALLIICKA